jgi:hypothetical protein
MENYLYFRKFRPATFAHTATAGAQTLTITGVGGDDIDSATEIASVTVTALGAANANVGSAYTAISEAGQVTTLAADGWSITNSIVTIDTITDTTNGYSLITGDIVTVTLQQGMETSVAYPSSRYKSIAETSATQTTITFNALKNGVGEEDDIVLTHTTGKHDEVVKMVDAALSLASGSGSASTAPTGKFISVVDGGGGFTKVLASFYGIGIIGLEYNPTAGY